MTHTGTPTRNFTGLGQPSQPPLLEHSNGWFLWLSYNEDRTLGTFLSLEPNGSILRHTIRATGGLDTAIVKAPKALASHSSNKGHSSNKPLFGKSAPFTLSPELLEQLSLLRFTKPTNRSS